MWFDKSEISKDLPNHIEFERVKMIKGLLFNVNADKSEDGTCMLDASKFCEMMSVPSKDCKDPEMVYNDFLLATVKTMQY